MKRGLIEKLRELPEKRKRIIFILTLVIFTVIIGGFWIKSTLLNLTKMVNAIQSINLQKIDIAINKKADMPAFDFNNFNNLLIDDIVIKDSPSKESLNKTTTPVKNRIIR